MSQELEYCPFLGRFLYCDPRPLLGKYRDDSVLKELYDMSGTRFPTYCLLCKLPYFLGRLNRIPVGNNELFITLFHMGVEFSSVTNYSVVLFGHNSLTNPSTVTGPIRAILNDATIIKKLWESTRYRISPRLDSQCNLSEKQYLQFFSSILQEPYPPTFVPPGLPDPVDTLFK